MQREGNGEKVATSSRLVQDGFQSSSAIRHCARAQSSRCHRQERMPINDVANHCDSHFFAKIHCKVLRLFDSLRATLMLMMTCIRCRQNLCAKKSLNCRRNERRQNSSHFRKSRDAWKLYYFFSFPMPWVTELVEEETINVCMFSWIVDYPIKHTTERDSLRAKGYFLFSFFQFERVFGKHADVYEGVCVCALTLFRCDASATWQEHAETVPPQQQQIRRSQQKWRWHTGVSVVRNENEKTN